jgi:hypothetical protein
MSSREDFGGRFYSPTATIRCDANHYVVFYTSLFKTLLTASCRRLMDTESLIIRYQLYKERWHLSASAFSSVFGTPSRLNIRPRGKDFTNRHTHVNRRFVTIHACFRHVLDM